MTKFIAYFSRSHFLGEVEASSEHLFGEGDEMRRLEEVEVLVHPELSTGSCPGLYLVHQQVGMVLCTIYVTASSKSNEIGGCNFWRKCAIC